MIKAELPDKAIIVTSSVNISYHGNLIIDYEGLIVCVLNKFST